METVLEEHRISVKELASFLHAAGDLGSQSGARNRRRLGQKLHEARQNDYLAGDEREVYVEAHLARGGHSLHISGRIDGVLHRDGECIVEEIKSTETDLSLLEEDTYPAHLRQAQIYAWLLAESRGLRNLSVWLTYIDADKRHRTFTKRYSKSTLDAILEATVSGYLEWLDVYREHQYEKRRSIEGLTFPFESYREGQYHFMGAVWQTLVRGETLYAEAPTGIGKTIAALYAGLKALKDEREKLFYLTAKNAGKSIAVDMVERMKQEGLRIKAITLNAKENLCLKDEVDCDPELCEYAKGFYNRLREALEDLFVHDDVYGAERIRAYGEFHTLCPHAFALEVADYCDLIICDFNYVFDPRIQLERYFADHQFTPRLLVDEAHNLVDRARSMHSATLSCEDLVSLEANTRELKPSPAPRVRAVLTRMEEILKESGADRSGFAAYNELDEALLSHLQRLLARLDDALQANKRHRQRKACREGFFEVATFLRIAEYFGSAYRFVIEREQEATRFSIACLDASQETALLVEKLEGGSVFFSATLTPIHYYSQLITRGEGKRFEVPSPFDPRRLGVFLDVSTSTKYRERRYSLPRIVDTIYALLETRRGNYIAFFPSYAYLEMAYEQFDATGYDVLKQERGMSPFAREEMLESFKRTSERSKVLFAVLGGSFSEAVDYTGEALSGVLIVGVALPAFNRMNEMIRDHFYEEGLNGFDYAYTYPGFNKVVQAVGRVIRTERDRGVAVLLDSRYDLPQYRALLPAHWRHVTLSEDHVIQDFLDSFWAGFKYE